MKPILFFALLFSIGCTDARFEDNLTWGRTAKINCWSGGKLILSSESSGVIDKAIFGNHYFFRDKESKKLIQVTGDCVITNAPWKEDLSGLFNKIFNKKSKEKTVGRFKIKPID